MLISCIMPTRGRREMAREALDCFHAQTYPDREIVIVDDLQDPSFHFSVAAEPRVKYIPIPGHQTIGSKRNIACEAATGQAIAHWDSDDLYAPERLNDQIARLVDSRVWLTGYNEVEFVADDGTRYMFRNTLLTPQGGKISNQHYAIGSSMMYWRSAWWNNRFQSTNKGEDNSFQLALQTSGRESKIHSVSARGLMTVRMHGDCTSNRGAEFLKRQEKLD